MIGRAIRTLIELPFTLGDALIARSPIGGEIMPNLPLELFVPASVTNYTDRELSSR